MTADLNGTQIIEALAKRSIETMQENGCVVHITDDWMIEHALSPLAELIDAAKDACWSLPGGYPSLEDALYRLQQAAKEAR